MNGDTLFKLDSLLNGTYCEKTFEHTSFSVDEEFDISISVINNVTMADEEEETEADENICPPGMKTTL